jgi:glutamine amidotransferase-like uncharacterized protein
MNLFQSYADINLELSQGELRYIRKTDTDIQFSAVPGPECRRMRYPKIGIYAGSGTSHSWLWFVDMFEKMGFFDLSFLDEAAVKGDGLKHLDVMVMSGGDTFAVAESLDQQGADKIRSFVEQGGVYIGSCAGAYLPMNSSKKPLDMFNFVDVKITNLSKTLPEFLINSCKSCSSYGCDFVFHPVREEIRLKPAGTFAAGSEFNAPLYGGPGMKVSDPATVLAYYCGFTEKTSFLVSEAIASKTLVGQAAIVRIPSGKGCFYLFGPHLEHPDYPHANKCVADAIFWETGKYIGMSSTYAGKHKFIGRTEILSAKKARDLVRELRRELSNSRIAASSLEFLPIRWLIGKKIYEPDKIRVFLESMWKRIKLLEKQDVFEVTPGFAEMIVGCARQTTAELRKIKSGVDHHQDTLDSATSVFDLLHKLSMSFFYLYFQAPFHDSMQH